jgi:hypothetical protein
MKNLLYIIGMFASVCVAVVGQAEVFPEPYRHYVSIAGIVGTAVNGYLATHPVDDAKSDNTPTQ